MAKLLDGKQLLETEDVKNAFADIINEFNRMRASHKELTQEQKDTLNLALKQLNAEHERILEELESTKLEAKSALPDALKGHLKEVNRIRDEILAMKPTDVDEESIIEEVLERIELPKYKETILDDPSQIKDKLESLKDDKRLDRSAIKGLDKVVFNDDLNRAISILDQRSQYLVNRTVKHDNTLTGQGTDASPLSVVGGGGGAVDSVNGQTGVVVLDTGDIAEATDANYVSDAQLVVIGNTSGTNTGDNATNTQYSGLAASKANVSGSLTQFVGNTPHRVFYSDASGDVVELALGADGTFLKSNGASVAPTFAVPAGSGDVSKVGTPVNNQIGVWTGDGTLEGDTALTFDTTTDTLSTGILNLASLTASEIVITDASKNLVSASVATYPSLTELTYVKGVTSAIQTQLNAKQATITFGTGVETALGVNVGSAGAFVTFNGALGTPSSGTVTNLTGTAGINITGTAPAGTLTGATLAAGVTASSLTSLGTIADLRATLLGVAGATPTTLNPFYINVPDSGAFVVSGATGVANSAAMKWFAGATEKAAFTYNDLASNLRIYTIGGDIGIYADNTTGRGITIATSSGNITMGGSLGITGTRVSKGWFTNLESTNMPTVGGTAILTSLTAPQFTTIELGAATDTTLSRSAAGVIAVEGVVIPSISSTNTLTNKRVTKRTGTTTSSATPTINTDNVDEYYITAQTEAITSFTTNLSGTPTLGQGLFISVIGTAARGITWGASFANGPVALPTTTVTTTQLSTFFKWDGSIWRCYATGSTV